MKERLDIDAFGARQKRLIWLVGGVGGAGGFFLVTIDAFVARGWVLSLASITYHRLKTLP
jgi:hypothetical protein